MNTEVKSSVLTESGMGTCIACGGNLVNKRGSETGCLCKCICKSFLQKGSHRQGGGCKSDEMGSVCAHI